MQFPSGWDFSIQAFTKVKRGLYSSRVCWSILKRGTLNEWLVTEGKMRGYVNFGDKLWWPESL